MMSDYITGIRAKIGNDLLMATASGALIFDDADRVLLARHAEGVWTNPGGMVEPYESPADAAVRETWEELGVLVRLTGLVGVFGGADHAIIYGNGDQLAYTATIFEASIPAGTPRPDGTELLEMGWFTKSEATTLDLTPQKRRHLEVGFRRQASGYFDPPTWRPPA